jgi:SMC interacting uncharacterized protein involved in chromosome segregation
MMNDRKEWLDELLEDLKQERDELRVRVHLAKLEANEEWQDLEDKWETLQSKAKAVAKATTDSAEDVGEAVKDLGKEIRNGFKNISRQL